MPIGDIATQWIRPAQGPEFFGKGYQMGAQVAESQARLQAAANAQQAQLNQEAQKEQLSAFLAQQKLEQDARLEQQKIEVGKQYHLAQIGLQQQKNAIAKQAADMKLSEMLKQESETRGYLQDIVPSEQGGPGIAPIAALARHPGMVKSGLPSALASYAKMQQAQTPETLEVEKRDGRSYVRRGGQWYPAGAETQTAQAKQEALLQREDIVAAERGIFEWDKEFALASSEDDKKLAREKMDELKRRVNAAYRKAGISPVRYPEVEGAPDTSGWTQIGGARVRQKSY